MKSLVDLLRQDPVYTIDAGDIFNASPGELLQTSKLF
jgi:hypothetical protein